MSQSTSVHTRPQAFLTKHGVLVVADYHTRSECTEYHISVRICMSAQASQMFLPIVVVFLFLLFFKGRTFDGHMLDMIELGIVGYRGLEELAGLAKRVGSKPAFVFAGEKWGREEAYRKLQNIFLGEALIRATIGVRC